VTPANSVQTASFLTSIDLTIHVSAVEGPVYVAVDADPAVFATWTLSPDDERTAVAMVWPKQGLASGTYQGELAVWLCSDEACHFPISDRRVVPYTLVKLDELIIPDLVTVHVSSTTPPDDLTLRVPMAMRTGPAHGWTARSDTPWLVIDTPGGVTGEDLVVHLDPAGLAGLQNGTSSHGVYTIEGDQPGMGFSVGVDVELALAEVETVTPASQPAGRPVRFHLHGTGFEADPALLQQVGLEGVEGTTATRVSPTELIISAPPLAPGAYTVGVRNRLGISVGTAPAHATAPTVAARAVLPIVPVSDLDWQFYGISSRLLWDPVNQALLVLELSSPAGTVSTVRRHALHGGSFTTSEHDPQGVEALGFTPDGRLLGPSRGFISLLDPVTLTQVGGWSAVPPQGYDPIYGATPLPVTADGRAWMLGTWLFTFDLQAGTFAQVPPDVLGVSVETCASPLVSRSGEHLLLSKATCASGAAYYEAADGKFRGVPGQTMQFADLSGDGERILALGGAVLDPSFLPLGSVPCWPALLSDDGRRAVCVHSPFDGSTPVVEVYDLTAKPGPDRSFPLLGSVPLVDPPCTAGDLTCTPRGPVLLTPDARVLFAATRAGIVVVPIPANLVDPP
jgi:hypothetical protein